MQRNSKNNAVNIILQNKALHSVEYIVLVSLCHVGCIYFYKWCSTNKFAVSRERPEGSIVFQVTDRVVQCELSFELSQEGQTL
jgi:hypothetical protein